MKKVVISLHGIRTRGVWQKELVPVLANNGLIPHPLDYGFFPASFLLFPIFRRQKIDWLRNECERIATAEGVNRVSIVAHSLGSLIVAEMLAKYETIKVDKVIFAGSIVKRDYNVMHLLESGQINLIENNFGNKDIWPKIAQKVVIGAGSAGANGFLQEHPLLIQKEFPSHRHSDYFHLTHFTHNWVPTLRRVAINEQDRKPLVDAMNISVKSVAAKLKVDSNDIRANIFTVDHDCLTNISIPYGLHYNLQVKGKPTKEPSLKMAIGTGCSGKAYDERAQVVAILDEDWSKFDLADSEAGKVNPALKWIISTPIPDPEDKWGIMGVMNIDGINVQKQLQDLDVLLKELRFYARVVGEAFRKLS